MKKKIIIDLNLKFCFIFFISVTFYYVYAQKNCVLALENPEKCLELIEPNNINELKKLRICIKKIKMESEIKRVNQIIEKSSEGSNKLTERIVNLNDKSKAVSK